MQCMARHIDERKPTHAASGHIPITSDLSVLFVLAFLSALIVSLLVF